MEKYFAESIMFILVEKSFLAFLKKCAAAQAKVKNKRNSFYLFFKKGKAKKLLILSKLL